MQASSTFRSSPHPQDAHQASALALEYGLKRQYLALLPPQQIIEICLTFEVHVPAYVKSTVWPTDLKAAIAAMSGHSMANSQPPQSSNIDDVPVMDSLLVDSSQPPPASTSPERPSTEPPHPEDQSTSSPSHQLSQSTAPANLSPQPSHRHQPYGYTHPEAAYPHTPYYPLPPPPGYPAYSAPYQSYPPPSDSFPPPPPHSYPPSHKNPPFNNTQPQDSFNNISPDDLPSYEEMLVEALTEAGDLEGCAPKDLFTWMASHYPVQSNFRPSASQALQKAFKRGRLEKSDGGKYRLNATWEGGNTSRRTTRRPQTHTQTTLSVQNSQTPTSSPFTHTPLIHHHQPPSATASAPSHPLYPGADFGYPYLPPPHPGHSGFTSYPPPPPTTTDMAGNTTEEGGVAWEAAQNILKAINFGGLLQLPSEHNETPDKASVPAPDADVTENQARLLGASSTEGIGMKDPSGHNARAALQAQLALLAAQLTEMVQAADPDGAGLEVGRDIQVDVEDSHSVS